MLYYLFYYIKKVIKDFVFYEKLRYRLNVDNCTAYFSTKEERDIFYNLLKDKYKKLSMSIGHKSEF